MRFCNKCDNMYYISVETENSNNLTYYCRSCGDTDNTITNQGLCVLDTNFKTGSRSRQHINQYTKLDPTLPRINNIPCPNENCKSHNDTSKNDNDVIYMRYDDTNLKYTYMCVVCDTTWNS